MHLLAGSSLLALASTASAQTAASGKGASPSVEEIIVTARRVEERIQDVPISITAFSQDQLSDRNVVNASDLATFTPGLTVNSRFGDDNTAFAIRGFSQELRTSASVGVYFGDVVAPRGGTSVTTGDGSGPGDYFDLANVQVLKGPQGTLFGRNTTGGAVLLVPNRPTDTLEGHIEASTGNYDLVRFQGVLNLPVSDHVRLRLGVDHQKRDGYLNNVSGIGPSDLSNVDYIAGRASLAVDLTESLENYTIVRINDSKNNGGVSQVFACNTEPGAGFLARINGPLCAGQLAAQAAAGHTDFYDVGNAIPDARNEQRLQQVINTTSWKVNDNIHEIKNIFAYADLEVSLRNGVFGTNVSVPTAAGPLPYYLSMNRPIPGTPTVDQRSMVDELQIRGASFDNRLTWQGGLYYEHSEPDGRSGAQSAGFVSCDLDSLGTDPNGFRCNSLVAPIGIVNRFIGGTEFVNKAIYGQTTFDIISDRLSLTGGLRYTWDKTTGDVQQFAYRFPPVASGGLFPPLNIPGVSPICADPGASLPDCRKIVSQESEAPTWLIGIDFKPSDDVLLYAKYLRGYRQGSVNIDAPSGLNTHDQEQVDTYEIGAKTSFDGPAPGTFNIGVFYNDFTDQQIQLGIFPVSGVGTTAIVNAGASTLWGVEVETSLELFEGFNLSASYTYLNTKLDELTLPPIPPGVLVPGIAPSLTSAPGEPLSFSPEHEGSATAVYALPVPETIGNVSLSATYVYTGEQQAVASVVTPFYKIPSYELLNLNLNWNGILGSRVDASLFATNLLEEEYWTFVSGQYTTTGFEPRVLGQPRMYGLRLRYRFGG